ncbi:hypothetical protein MASR2M36_12490 [Providencia sp.]
MTLPTMIDSVYLIDIQYKNDEANLTIAVNGVSKIFVCYPKTGVISVISSSEALWELLVYLMPYEHSINKKIFKSVWDFINGKDINFPIKLI